MQALIQNLIQNLRYALRQLMRAPGFSATVIVTLALGIGANSAIFTIFDQVLLRMLPVQRPKELVRFQWSGSFSGSRSSFGGESGDYVSYPMYKDLRDRNSAFSGILAADRVGVGISWHDQSENEDGEVVSGNYFDLLGLHPAAGRLFTEADDVTKNANPVVILGYDYWKTHFNGASDIPGQTLLVNGHPFTILGVAPPGFHSAIDSYVPKVYLPLTMVEIAAPWMVANGDFLSHKSIWLTLIARLKPGVTKQQAEASLAPLWYSLRAQELTAYKEGPRFKETFLTQSHLSVKDDSTGFMPGRSDLRTPLVVLLGMVGVLAAMCSVNIATLLLLRSAGRVREMSMRYALGAARSRVFGQLLVEGGLLGAAGAIVGLALSPVISSALVRIMLHADDPADSPFSPNVDSRVLLFTLAISLVVCLFFSITPALQFLRPRLAESLRQSAGTASRRSQLLRKIAVGMQIALTILLLGGAGLFLRTLSNLRGQNIGVRAANVVSFNLDPTLAGYDDKRTPQIELGVLDALRTIPGVQQVSGTTDPVIAGTSSHSTFSVQGHVAAEGENMHFEDAWVTPGYYATLGQPILAGRDFSVADTKTAPKVAIVNLTFARRFYGSPQNALGHLLSEGRGSDAKFYTAIVGVVGNVNQTSVRDKPAEGVYRPYLQLDNPGGLRLYALTGQAPEAVESGIRDRIHRYDPRLVVDDMRTMVQQLDRSVSNARALATLAASFSALALMMTCVGLYGVLAFATKQRTREIGVRMALGAQRGAVMLLVLREMALTTAVAVAVALPAAFGLSRLIQSQLYQVSPGDPLTLAGCILASAIMVLLAAAIPARRAASVDPMLALRSE
jgi:putative ABC transport system permease protein